MNINPVKAFGLFYDSQTSADLHDKNTGHGNMYVADGFIMELKNSMNKNKIMRKTTGGANDAR